MHKKYGLLTTFVLAAFFAVTPAWASGSGNANADVTTVVGTGAVASGGDENIAIGSNFQVVSTGHAVGAGAGQNFTVVNGTGAVAGGGDQNVAVGTSIQIVDGTNNQAAATGAVAAGGTGNTAIGVECQTVNGSSNHSVGVGAMAGAGNYNTAIGTNAQAVHGDGNKAVGYGTQAGYGDYNTAVGSHAAAGGGSSYNTAVGAGALAIGGNSVALGVLSVADRPNTVSVGSPGYERQITNVAPGTAGTDAVNLNQLHGVENKTERVGAMGFAMSALAPICYDPKNPTQYSAGIGTYDGTNAIALGVFHYTKQDVMINAAVAMSDKGWEKAARFGITWRTGGPRPKAISPATEETVNTPKEDFHTRIQKILAGSDETEQ